MGVVYSALDEQNARRVAIKVMMTDLEGDPETRERFYREAKIAGRLQHRNLISVYDMGEEDGRLYMVMELLQGDTLNDYLKRVHTLSLEATLDFMSQMCEGLAVAHVHGIFHRDIKPGNIFVQDDGSLKVLDFGVARLADSNMTASGFIVGTPDFMSPEQARGAEIDHRSDIFSTGAVFYYMLSGRKPFAATDLPAVLHKVEAEDPAAADRSRSAGRALEDRLEGARQVRHAPVSGARGAADRPDALSARLRPAVARESRGGSRTRARAAARLAAARERGTGRRPTRISSAWRFASGIRCSKTRAPTRSASFRSGVRPCTRSKRRSNAACRCSWRDAPRSGGSSGAGGGRMSRTLARWMTGGSSVSWSWSGRRWWAATRECEISHADPRLSRRHAEFRVTADGVRLRDLGSRNGTLVNGHPVDETVLTPGDVVQIAHLTIRFNDAGADPTVHMARGGRAGGHAVAAAAAHVQDDRTRVLSPAEAAIARAPTAVGMPMPLDDRTRLKLSPPAHARRGRRHRRVRPAAASAPSPTRCERHVPPKRFRLARWPMLAKWSIRERPGQAARAGRAAGPERVRAGWQPAGAGRCSCRDSRSRCSCCC